MCIIVEDYKVSDKGEVLFYIKKRIVGVFCCDNCKIVCYVVVSYFLIRGEVCFIRKDVCFV